MKKLIIGLTLFALVMTGIYLVIFLDELDIDIEEKADMIIPLIVFTGFFIFLIAAILVAMSIYNYPERKKFAAWIQKMKAQRQPPYQSKTNKLLDEIRTNVQEDRKRRQNG